MYSVQIVGVICGGPGGGRKGPLGGYVTEVDGGVIADVVCTGKLLGTGLVGGAGGLA